MNDSDLKVLLEEAYMAFAKPDFLDNDPIQIPHRYKRKEDIEIAGFISATIAWGQRVSIINSGNRFLAAMNDQPFDFIINHEPIDRNRFKGFAHRTFNEVDAMYFMERLQRMYRDEGGLEEAFSQGDSMLHRISNFHQLFFDKEYPSRTKKHVSNPLTNSAAKRLNMYLRWMVRTSSKGVDFGIWNNFKPSELMMPLDVHTANVGRKLGLLNRKQNDWKSVEELTKNLQTFDATDPVKYDLALFGLGVSKAI